MNAGVHSWVLFSVPLILSGFTFILQPLFLAANSDIVAILTKAGDGKYMNLQLTMIKVSGIITITLDSNKGDKTITEKTCAY